ncbi:jupiter microtubule associated homolog 2 isoform X2 [Lissotriton helveticus]
MQSCGGGASNIFGSPQEVPSSNRNHKMSSSIFASPEDPQSVPKRSNPPGGKGSGIFHEPVSSPARQLTNPPGGRSSNIFGDAVNKAPVVQHPNKPKDNISLYGRGEEVKKPVPASENSKEQVDIKEKQDLRKEEQAKEPGPSITDHEPRLGPVPRAHNKVLNPPGGKSSIIFY